MRNKCGNYSFFFISLFFYICVNGIYHTVIAQDAVKTDRSPKSDIEDLKWRLKQMEVRQQEEISALKTRLKTISAESQPAAPTAPKSEIEDLKWQLKQMEARQQEEIKALKIRLETVSAEVQPAAPIPSATPSAPTTPIVTKEEVQHTIEDYLATDEARKKMGIGMPGVTAVYTPDDEKYALSLRSPDGNYTFNFGARMQFRYTYDDRDEDFDQSDVQDVTLRRARAYFGGNIYTKFIHYYVELDADKFNVNMRDFYIYVTPLEELNGKFGFFKVPFNRQRMASSSKLLLQDRSIASEAFDQDRDYGIDFYGHPFDGHVEYHAAVFRGNGEKTSANVDNELMYILGLRYNPFGEYDYYDETDIKYSKDLKVTMGAAVTFNAKKQDVKLMDTNSVDGTTDLGLKYKGISWNSEYYIRSDDPESDGTTVNSDGFFTQVGYFLIPKKLEFAVRYSMVDPDKDLPDDLQKEYTVGLNYYFRGHRSQIQGDVGHFTTATTGQDLEENKIRVQYQIIF